MIVRARVATASRSHLEALGIGRPSTYATIIKSLQDRGYCSMVSKTLRPQQRGQLVTALLTSESLEQYVHTDFTARLEAELDAISAGELVTSPAELAISAGEIS